MKVLSDWTVKSSSCYYLFNFDCKAIFSEQKRLYTWAFSGFDFSDSQG